MSLIFSACIFWNWYVMSGICFGIELLMERKWERRDFGEKMPTSVVWKQRQKRRKGTNLLWDLVKKNFSPHMWRGKENKVSKRHFCSSQSRSLSLRSLLTFLCWSCQFIVMVAHVFLIPKDTTRTTNEAESEGGVEELVIHCCIEMIGVLFLLSLKFRRNKE